MGTSGTVEAGGATVVVDGAVRLLVAGGDTLERDALARALDEQDGLNVVAVARRDDGALARVAAHCPHVAVVLYDEASDLDLCRRLSIRRPRVGVVMADSFRSVRDFEVCQEVGAQGFVHRDSPVETLTDAVRAVAAGGSFHDPHIPDEAPDGYGLTDREFDVLRALDFGRSRRKMAVQLGISEHGVKFHLSSIYRKLGVGSRGEALAVALHEGLVKPSDRDARRET